MLRVEPVVVTSDPADGERCAQGLLLRSGNQESLCGSARRRSRPRRRGNARAPAKEFVRNARRSVQLAYTEMLIKLGIVRGESSPCSFRHAERGIYVDVHGDGIFSEGTASDLKWFNAELTKNFQIETEVLDPDSSVGEVSEISFLKRVISQTKEDIVGGWSPTRRTDHQAAEPRRRQGGLHAGRQG